MSKKLISLLLAVCMFFCLSACGTTETNSKPTDTPTESQTDIEQDTDENTVGEESSQVSSNTEETNGNETQTQTSTNQSKPTSITNQPTHNHSYSNATCISPKKCSCGATAGTALGHQFASATCTSPKLCGRCGVTSGKSLGHNYSAANCYSPKTCTRCGQMSGNALGHKYNKGKCTVCDSADPEATVFLYNMDMFDAQNEVDKTQNKYDTYGNFYDKVIQFGDQNNWYSPDPVVTYRLAGNYSKFEGTISYYDSNKSGYDNYWMDGNLTIKIYKDSEMIYMKDNITKWTEPILFSLDMSNCNFLKIEVRNTKDAGNAYLLLGNAVVKK